MSRTKSRQREGEAMIETNTEDEQALGLTKRTRTSEERSDKKVIDMHEDVEVDIVGKEKTARKGEQQQQQPGIVYIARIPPGMNPGGIRTLLMEHGSVGRVFLQPEDAAVKRRRKKNGGMDRYVEGWIEFQSKKDAKQVAMLLDGTRMGPKKGRRFYDDMWSLKYLSGFTWEHLTEKTARERKQREQMLRLEFAKAKRDDELYMQQLKKNKMVKLMDARRHGADSAAAESLKSQAEQKIRQLQPIV